MKTYPGDLRLITCTSKDVPKYVNTFCYTVLVKRPTIRGILYKLVSTLKRSTRKFVVDVILQLNSFSKLIFFPLKHMHVYIHACVCLYVF